MTDALPANDGNRLAEPTPARWPQRATSRPTLGLIGHDLMSSSFAGDIMQGAQAAAEAAGAVLVIMTTSDDPQIEAQQVGQLLRERVDGVLCGSGHHALIAVPDVARANPLVVVNAASADPLIPSVAPDEHACGWAGTDVLVRAGHRRICFIADDRGGLASAGREAGFRARAAAAGVLAGDLQTLATTPDAAGAFGAALRLLSSAAPPTAVLCVNDRVAVGVYRAAAALGLALPRDLSVVGIGEADDTAQALQPALTKVLLPHREIGERAARHLIEHITTGRRQPQALRLPGRVVARDSVAAPSRA